MAPVPDVFPSAVLCFFPPLVSDAAPSAANRACPLAGRPSSRAPLLASGPAPSAAHRIGPRAGRPFYWAPAISSGAASRASSLPLPVARHPLLLMAPASAPAVRPPGRRPAAPVPAVPFLLPPIASDLGNSAVNRAGLRTGHPSFRPGQCLRCLMCRWLTCCASFLPLPKARHPLLLIATARVPAVRPPGRQPIAPVPDVPLAVVPCPFPPITNGPAPSAVNRAGPRAGRPSSRTPASASVAPCASGCGAVPCSSHRK